MGPGRGSFTTAEPRPLSLLPTWSFHRPRYCDGGSAGSPPSAATPPINSRHVCGESCLRILSEVRALTTVSAPSALDERFQVKVELRRFVFAIASTLPIRLLVQGGQPAAILVPQLCANPPGISPVRVPFPPAPCRSGASAGYPAPPAGPSHSPRIPTGEAPYMRKPPVRVLPAMPTCRANRRARASRGDSPETRTTPPLERPGSDLPVRAPVQPAVDSQPQFYQQVEVLAARGNRRPLELQYVPRREVHHRPRNGSGPREVRLQKQDVPPIAAIPDRHVCLHLVVPLHRREE